MSKGWIGVDLDGTLAHHDGASAPHQIGAPIAPMVARVKAWLAEGKDVRIMTARACPDRFDFGDTLAEAVKAVQDWTEMHVGVRLPVTASKDYLMVELWDDRAVHVIPNTGRPGVHPSSLNCFECGSLITCLCLRCNPLTI